MPRPTHSNQSFIPKVKDDPELSQKRISPIALILTTIALLICVNNKVANQIHKTVIGFTDEIIDTIGILPKKLNIFIADQRSFSKFNKHHLEIVEELRQKKISIELLKEQLYNCKILQQLQTLHTNQEFYNYIPAIVLYHGTERSNIIYASVSKIKNIQEVKIGSVVHNQFGLIGKVIEVFKEPDNPLIKIQLATDKQFYIIGKESKKEEWHILKGNGKNGLLLMNYEENDNAVSTKEGSKFFATSIENLTIPEIFLGTVTKSIDGNFIILLQKNIRQFTEIEVISPKYTSYVK